MRTLIAPAAVILSLALGTAAFAATTTPAKPSAHAQNPSHAKRTACEAAWKAEKSHTGTEKAFVKACMAKG